jgi:hypothetical protein
MQRDVVRELGIESAKEAQKLLVPMSGMVFAHDLALQCPSAANRVVVPLRL